MMASSMQGICQKYPSIAGFGEPIVTDSASTMFIPERYDDKFLSSSKISIWEYYANVIVYNFKTDTYKKLFEKETFIEAFHGLGGQGRASNYITKNWIFLLVKTTDLNGNEKIDDKDPSLLFAVSNQGENLKPLTDVTEDVVSVESFEKLGFMLIKIRKDSNKDKTFDNNDGDYYYKRLSLSDLGFGKAIELK
jgi:hypothetical protein